MFFFFSVKTSRLQSVLHFVNVRNKFRPVNNSGRQGFPYMVFGPILIQIYGADVFVPIRV